MRIARLVGLAAVAVAAMSTVATSAAAALPSFDPGVKNLFSATSTESVLRANNDTEVVACKSGTAAGEIINAMEVGNVVVKFTQCTSSSPTKTKCVASSPGAATGELLTKTLHGILGLALPKPATGSDIGLLVLPSTGNEFVTIEENECTRETAVSGSVAGLMEPVGRLQKTSKLVFHETANVQDISNIDTLAGLIRPRLTAFSTAATEESNELITYEKSVEVA
jgi:hypothetical protein